MWSSMEIIIAVAQILLALGTLSIAYIAYLLSKQAHDFAKKAESAESHRKVKESFNTMNIIGLSNKENLETLDAIEHPKLVDQPIEEKRKRWIGIIMINALETAYLEKKKGILDFEYADSTLKSLVPLVIQDNILYEELHFGGYDPNFVRYCDDLKS